ncbi:protein kinase domain-containing protein [Streptomyces tsukubensis]|uniref:Serine/threonine protein kinase n=3 Tax=Streptomyces tsukubensis TaxID=83656 RepID=A0A7G3URS4_STRT9|nr:serine/threonine-protein kinase [Streptomyces tsukubensis]AZK95749.1 serine/threonine protein kinase [Streptomyces tsukubensis]QKM71610.1 serine/threonine protein kinase [Streptomyces tsukubensis NRRL18488]
MPPLRSTGQASESGQPEYAGQYRLEASLGTGGMGVVHLATSASGLRLAVKVIHAEHATDPEFRARFRQEVAAARRVSGAFTAPVVDADPEAGRPWMATLFIDGPTLSERVKRNGPMDPEEARRAGAGLAEALRDIHRVGVVHRDLKPSNVLLAPDGPKVIDFGISRPVDSDLRTETGKLIGTPPFMAPEQFQRPREVGPAADVFAMGAVLVHAMTGRGPFDSDSPYIVAYQVVHDEPDLAGVPSGLVPLIRRCLAKDPAARPTPYELMVALREASPSASYDTQAYVPVPRSPDPRESVPGPLFADGEAGSGSGTGTGSVFPEVGAGAGGPSEPPSGGGAAGPKRKRRRWAVAAAALVVLVAGGAVVARTAGDGSGPDSGSGSGSGSAARSGTAAARSDAAAGAPEKWSVRLGEARGEERTPACTLAPDAAALFCAAPGVRAARLDPATGRTVWSRPAGKGAPADIGPRAPVFAGGLVHVRPPGGGPAEALDPATGTPRWSTPVRPYEAVRHVGDLVLLVRNDGRVRALDARTGRERWQARHGSGGVAEWVDGGRTVYAVAPETSGAGTTVRAVDPDTGLLLRQHRLEGTLRPAGYASGALLLITTDASGSTDAVVRLTPGDGARGRAVERIALDAPVPQAQAVVSGGAVYLSGAGGSLVAVRLGRAGGPAAAQSWRLETGATHLSRPVTGGPAVFVGAGDGRLLAVHADRGRLLGQTDPRMDGGARTYTSFLPAPVAAGDRVFGTAPDGSVYAMASSDPARF